MVYTLRDLSQALREGRHTYEQHAREAAEKISLRQVISAAEAKEHLVGNVLLRRDHRFTDGDTIPFSLEGVNVTVHPQRIILESDHIKLKEITGPTVERFYAGLSRKLVAGVEEHLENLPF